MKLPPNEQLGGWADELAQQCNVSVVKRTKEALMWRSYFYDGCAPGETRSSFNKTGAHVDALSSALFSPAALRFWLEFDLDHPADVYARAETTSGLLTKEFGDSRVSQEVANTLPFALAYGKSFIKLDWRGGETKPWAVMPYELGVYREERNWLTDQEAICQTYYVGRDELARRVKGHGKESEIVGAIDAYKTVHGANDEGFFKVVMGGTQPIVTQGTPATAGFASPWNSTPMVELSPAAANDLIKMYEVWVWDDEREDWTTLQLMAGGTVIEGELQRRNIFVPGHLPFKELCPNPVPGYFWGMSEIAQVRKLQDAINHCYTNIMELYERQNRRNYAYSGFQGINQEKAAAFNRPGGWVSEGQATGGSKIDDLTPPLPQNPFAPIHELSAMFDEVAGFTPTLKGQGDTGVRSGDQAETLVRMSSPRLRDRALLVENQVAELGDLNLKLMQDRMGEQFKFGTDEGDQFYLKSIPEDYTVTVDAHSSSPVFSEDAIRHASLLKSQGVIDEEDFLRLTCPPTFATILRGLRKRKAAQAKFAQEHPELMAKQMGHKKK